MDIHNEFIGALYNLVFYAGKPVLNRVHEFTDCEDTPWDFSAALGFSFNIWEEREGGLQVIAWSSPNNLASSGSVIILNAPASDTSIERGKYYYEMEYTVAGGYPILLMYGEAKFI